MSGEPPAPNLPRGSRPRNLTYAAIAGLAGLVTLVIVVAALLAGLWVDSLLGARGPFTIGFVILSVPLSLFSMVRIAFWATKAIQPPQETTSSTTAKED